MVFEMYKIEKFKVGTAGNYTYIISDPVSKIAVSIDPAWELNKIEECLQESNTSLKAILLTHSHYDHTNLALHLANRFNCNLYMSRDEIEFYKFTCVNLVPVNDGDIVNVDNLLFKCILTPGHTAGSMCFKIGNNLFTGDTLFIRGCGFCNCNGGSVEQMFESINKLKAIITNDISIYPGHYFKDDLKHEKEYIKRNIYLHIENEKLFKRLITLNSRSNNFLKYKNSK